jgi:membrane associated rhomboid family serine protease
MVFPISDESTGQQTPPIVNWLLIAINVFVFVVPQRMGENDRFTYAFSTVPAKIVTGDDFTTRPQRMMNPVTGEVVTQPGLPSTPIPVYLTLITSTFLHGGWLHILGNMWFLYIFGDNVEDHLGHALYLVYYLLCGILASLAHVFATVMFYGAQSTEALVPSLGASGAISGVLGGYILLFPHNPVTVFLFRFLTVVPAWVAIGIWFGFQVVSGLPMLGGKDTGGVAYAAHIGGFIAGVALMTPFTLGNAGQRPPPHVPWPERDY